MKSNFPAPDSPLAESMALQLSGIAKTFGIGDARMMALRNANFDARFGELTMLVGPSGCGKTTLLSIMAGTLSADAGTINVLGHSLHNFKEATLTRFRANHVGFVFQQFNLIATLTTAENVSVPLVINGASPKDAEARAIEILERVGLKGREKEMPTKLSGGQQQRVAIARALIHNPPLLICDEPTSALDRETGHEIMEMICHIARDPARCVVVVSHDPRIYRYADRMAEMEDGAIIRVLKSPAEIQAAH